MTTKKRPAVESDPRPDPGTRERAAIEAAYERLRETPAPVSVGWTPQAQIRSPDHNDDLGHAARLMQVFGTRSHDSFAVGAGALDYVSRSRGSDRGISASGLNASLALLHSIGPRDELEAALAMQLAGCHVLAMEMLGRARQSDRTDHIQLYGGLAVKLQRTFAAQAEALAKLRGGGKQQVEVRHVYVNGNAVIGDVRREGAGGGGTAGNCDQPHAQSLAHLPGAPVAPMWSADAGRDALPVAGGAGTEAMPDARRAVARGGQR